MMKIVNSYPPNIDMIRAAGLVAEGNIYCYGDAIYIPSGEKEVPIDLDYHEHIHSQRQGDDPQTWWNKYCTDSEFRFEEELIAYAKQYQLVKQSLNDKEAKEYLEEYGINLATLYGLDLTKEQAKTRIRKYHK